MEINHSDGVLKFDEKKLDLRLVEPWVEEELCKIYMYGVKKYHEGSWKKFSKADARRTFISAAKRHMNAYRNGEFTETGTGLDHLVQAAWNLLTLHYHEKREGN